MVCLLKQCALSTDSESFPLVDEYEWSSDSSNKTECESSDDDDKSDKEGGRARCIDLTSSSPFNAGPSSPVAGHSSDAKLLIKKRSHSRLCISFARCN